MLSRRCARPLLYAGVGIVLIPLSFLPNLVVAEDSPTFRVQVALTSLMALYVCLGAIGIWLTVRDSLVPRVRGRTVVAAERLAFAFAAGFVGLSVFFAAKNVSTLLVEPQMTELRLLRGQVAALPPGGNARRLRPDRLHPGTHGRRPLRRVRRPFSVQIFNLEPSLLLLLREEGRLGPDGMRPAVDLFPSTATEFPKDEPVLDLRGLQGLRCTAPVSSLVEHPIYVAANHGYRS